MRATGAVTKHGARTPVDTTPRLPFYGGALVIDLCARVLPVDSRLNQFHAAPVLVLHGKGEERVDHVVAKKVGLREAEVLQVGALDVVVVLFQLDAGVGHALRL